MLLGHLAPMAPELFILLMACAVLLADAFFNNAIINYALTQLTLVVAAVLIVFSFDGHDIQLLNHQFVLDHLSYLMGFLVCVVSFLVLVYSRTYIKERPIASGEYYVLSLLSVLGMLVLISSDNLLVMYLGLELFSLPLYAMIALQRNVDRCVEASMKYFVMGAVASCLLLYGFSLLFGATKSLNIPEIAQAVANLSVQNHALLVLGLVFVAAGVIFKLGAAPFHMWVPDVYEGAPSSVTLFIASAPKLAAFVLAVRLMVEALPGLDAQWESLLIVVAIASMALGNLVAIAQDNIKRMLAYSSIAHFGYMLLGLLAGTADGYASAMFYMISYTLMTTGAFGLIVLMSRNGFETEKISDFVGLNTRNPWLAFMMLLIMFSMAGIPPIVGFIAKLGVLEALIQVHLVWLAVLALLFAIIGAYYYLNIVKVMYFEEPVDSTPVLCSNSTKVALSINGLLVLMMGIFPGALFTICRLSFS